jgi:thymidylate synthase
MRDNEMEGYIPVLHISSKGIAEAWEQSVLKLWEQGVDAKTEYDRPGDPLSKDSTMIIEVEEPFTEPRIHRSFPGGIEDLEKYRLEVLDGVHDHWIRPEDGKWSYTYHDRITNFSVVDDLSSSKIKSPFKPVDQLQYLIDKLSQSRYSRRAQAITWMPTADPPTNEPPCLQRLWCRILNNNDDKPVLNMNTHWRSRDAYKAAFMNIYALTELQKMVSEKISEKCGEEVGVGRYVDISDSYHIYGQDHKEFKDRFLKGLKERTFEQRTWRSDDENLSEFIKIAHDQLQKEKEEGV